MATEGTKLEVGHVSRVDRWGGSGELPSQKVMVRRREEGSGILAGHKSIAPEENEDRRSQHHWRETISLSAPLQLSSTRARTVFPLENQKLCQSFRGLLNVKESHGDELNSWI